MSAWQSNFAATFHRRVRWWPVRGNCETSPLRAVASRVKPSFPSELSSSVASSQRMKATRLSLKVQRFAGPVPRNSALPSPRYVLACSDRSAICAGGGDPWPRRLLSPWIAPNNQIAGHEEPPLPLLTPSCHSILSLLLD